MAEMKIVIIGAGRAGSSFATALSTSHDVTLVHHNDVPHCEGVDLVLLCVPDDAIELVSNALEVPASTVVAHVAGSRGLEVLRRHSRVGSLHPLLTMPNARVGAERLRGGVYCVNGDEVLNEVVTSLEGRRIEVTQDRRALYHATAASAANHLVALMAQVQSLAQSAQLELRDFLPLAHQALEDVANLGPRGALTGPAARGDAATLEAHLRALPDDERATYGALAHRAQRLAHAEESTWSI